MATAPEKTGIKNADELIALAVAFELTIKVTTEKTPAAVTHTIRITMPVPPVYNGTDLGRAIAANVLTTTWSKGNTPRARGLLVGATLENPDAAPRKVRTLAGLDSAVRDLGHDAARHARDTAARPEDVVDTPHTLYFGDEPRRAGVPAAQVRRIVAVRRRSGRAVNQHPETGTIHIGNHSYVPAEHAAPVVPRFHMRSVNGGTPERISSTEAVAEMNSAQMEGRRHVREMSASGSSARIVYKDPERGTVLLRPATPEESGRAATAPATPEEQKAAESLGAGEKWICHDFGTGQGAPYRTVSRESALKLITEHLRSGAEVAPSHEGGVNIKPTTGRTSYWLRPFPAMA
ncbi:hypothetical protein ACFU96_21370 [Streptomyces sp. NPDC057620]|uniref:hypothetical protein n=1 Tax=Streptomyces sp. NPDC057620 TaxID=3346185 RepID=UPI003696AD9C